MNESKLLLKKLNYILNRYQKILCVLVFALTCIGSVLECIGVSAIIPVVNVILNPEMMKDNIFVARNSYLSKLTSEQLTLVIIALVIGIFLFKNLFFIFLSWVRIKFASKIQRETAIKMMRSYMGRGYQFFLKKNYGELYRGVAEDTISLYAVLYAGLRMISDILTILLLCLFLMITDWIMALTMVLISLICVMLIYFVFRKKMEYVGREYRKYSARAGQAVLQAFQGIKDVLISKKQSFFVNEYEKNQVKLQLMRCKQIVGQESPTYIIESICITGLMSILAVRILIGNTQSTLFLANMAAFVLAAFRILPSLGRISISVNQITTSIPSIEGVWENLKEAESYTKLHPEAYFEYSVSKGLIDRGVVDHTSESNIENYTLKRAVELRNITFRYSKDIDYILKNVNLTIHKGEAIALIGTSGAGKSTLVDILLGLLLPEEGMVCLDGKNITEISDIWSRVIGYVPQTVFLSDDTIMNNIAFGEKSADIDRKRVEEAIEKAELSEYIQSLPEGVDTFVGDRGVRLSGGQRQRIAIARALYHKPQVLVLDEATSALDNDTEAAIMSAIDFLQGTLTLVIVAHRLTTVKNCDVIYEVKNQGIIERSKEEIFSN